MAGKGPAFRDTGCDVSPRVGFTAVNSLANDDFELFSDPPSYLF